MMGWQFWIDRGGTFTDLIGIGPNKEFIVKKVLSENPDCQFDPATKCIKEILKLNPEKKIPQGLIKEIRLGTTVATNALLEGTGSTVVLFCNKGLADVMKIGDQQRPDLFSLKIERPRFIAQTVIEVSGRINAKGEEIEPIDITQEIKDIINQYKHKEQISIAIALINSYKNATHELQLEKWLKEIGFRSIICSHQVSPLPRLVPRGQTTLVEASVAPVLKNYLQELRGSLGKSTPLNVMGSNGALLIPQLLLAKDTIFSGPAGGMVGAISIARISGFTQQPLIGFDMGGTSTDVFYATAGQENNWQRDPETEIAGQKLMAQRLPIHTVASGGGSVIYTKRGRLRVGPRSAGSNPGPTSYRRNGPLTITDANFLLGRLQLNEFPKCFGPLANQYPDIKKVQKEFRNLADKLNSTPEKVAEGALTIAIERMADAIKQVSIFCGHDIRDAVLIAYGGAGGQHACRLANQLGIKQVLVHPLAGVLSAYGIGIASQTHIQTKNIREKLDQTLLRSLHELRYREQKRAEIILYKNMNIENHKSQSETKCIARVEIRYQSSEQGLTINFEEESTINSLIQCFEETHLKKFNFVPLHNEPLIIERLEIEVMAPSCFKRKIQLQSKNKQEIKPKLVPIHLERSGWKLVPSYKRLDLVQDLSLTGPALIIEETSSIVLEEGWNAIIDSNGCLLLRAINPDTNTIIATKQPKEEKENTPNPVLLELYHHRFTVIAEKMGDRLKQTSRSVNIRERMDFSCAVFNKDGSLVANAPHIPVHLGAMGESILDLLSQIKEGGRNPLLPLETVITNDPYHGGTHLPDITAITPVFAGQKTPQYFVACRGHHADVGGITPGSMPPFSKNIYEEGLLLRNETYVINGEHDHSTWIKRLNEGNNPPRNPSEMLADLDAQVAANHLGVQELERLVSLTSNVEVKTYMEHLNKNASYVVQEIIKTLNNNYFTVELDNGKQLSVEIIVDKEQGKAKLNFSGTSSQGNENFQAPLAVTKAAVLYVFRCLLKEDIPLNAGCFEPLELIIPKGCLLNPLHPAAVVAGNVETSQALCNLLFGALGVSAASQGTMNNLTFGNSEHSYYETIGGGSGAGNGFNGTDGIQTNMTNSRITDPEILEERYPVRLEIFEIKKQSGGKGKWKGGNGLLRKFRFLQPLTLSILSSSRRIPPFGLKGGLPGNTGSNHLEKTDGKLVDIGGCATIQMKTGEAIIITTPGGGGYGKLSQHID